jgi:hypothetical protein
LVLITELKKTMGHNCSGETRRPNQNTMSNNSEPLSQTQHLFSLLLAFCFYYFLLLPILSTCLSLFFFTLLFFFLSSLYFYHKSITHHCRLNFSQIFQSPMPALSFSFLHL